jgi:hypothetical protein
MAVSLFLSQQALNDPCTYFLILVTWISEGLGEMIYGESLYELGVESLPSPASTSPPPQLPLSVPFSKDYVVLHS